MGPVGFGFSIRVFGCFQSGFLRDAISFTLPARGAHAALGLLVSTVGQQCTMRAAFRDARKGSAKHRISVSVRVKPASAKCSPTISADSRGIVVKQKVFTPEAVITGSDQAEAFAAIASPLLARLRDGYSRTLLAYGQTGSGKTHTMFGPPGALTGASLAASADACPPDWGIFPRIALELLAAGGTLHASAIEVYQDNAYDLLADRAPLQVGTRSVGRQVRGGGAIVANASKAVSAGSAYGSVHPNHCQCGKCFKRQEQERAERAARRNAEPRRRPAQREMPAFATVGETLVNLTTPAAVARLARTIELTRTAVGHALNARSSRSHCLVHLYRTERKNGDVRRQHLLFVDLAGSERIRRTGVEGVAASQAMAINSNLTVLGKVCRALACNAPHVPFRDSMLTRLLRSSLEGRAATAVVINAASDPEHECETLCSLAFGERMGAVKTAATPVIRRRALDAGAAEALREELRTLRAAMARMEADDLDLGRFHEDAVPSEAHSLKHNLRRHAQYAAAVTQLRAQLAEGGGGDLAARLAHEEAEATNLHSIIEMQKTIPVVRGGTSLLWLGPPPSVHGGGRPPEGD